MSIDITQELLDEVNTFVNTKLVCFMINDELLSIAGEMFILQLLTEGIDKFQEKLNKKNDTM